MADLNDIAVFVRVAQFESFSRAAHALGMPVSTVSRKVSALEAELGVTLLQRTTRKLALTSQGRDYFNQCSEPLNLLFDAERVLTQTQKKPEGSLKISVPVVLGQGPFLEFISDFLKNYPRITIDLFITNVFLDLIAENVDVGIRFGELKDSTLIAKKLGSQVRYVVASPEYLKDRKPPTKPEDLKLHQCVLLNGKNSEAEWELLNGRKSARIRVSGPISSRDFQSVSAFVYRGHGVGKRLPAFKAPCISRSTEGLEKPTMGLRPKKTIRIQRPNDLKLFRERCRFGPKKRRRRSGKQSWARSRVQ